MQQWIRQRNKARRAACGTRWPAAHGAGARFRAHLKRVSRAATPLLLLVAVAFAAEAQGAADAVATGGLFARVAGAETPMPSLATRFDVDVSGPVARTRLRQRFRNDSAEWIEAVYRFPLPEDAAVDHLRVTSGGRHIVGVIREREQAAADYRAARDSGRRAALVSQQRANLFTTALANVGPGATVTVEIEYQQRVTRDGERYRLRIPTTVMPRYAPGDAAESDAMTVAMPAAATPSGSHGLAIDIDLDAGLPIAEIVSRDHRIDVAPAGGDAWRVALSGGARTDGDFVLEWRVASSADARVATFTHAAGEHTYALLQLVPPLATPVNLAPARELIVVLDTSGSMQGAALEAAVSAARLALGALRPVDTFNVIAFDNDTQRLFDAPRTATADNVAAARAWLGRQRADGGTEMRPALMQALRGRTVPDGMLRQVIFVTDGAVANEAALFRDIGRWIGGSRLFTVGIGAAPNGWFMREAAQAGRGRFVLAGSAGDVEPAMARLFGYLAQPVLTDIELDWGEAAVEAYPSRVADLYAGEPVEISARFDGVAPKRLRLRATQWIGGIAMPWTHSVDLGAVGGDTRHGVAVTWARDKLEALADARRAGLPDAIARQAMLETALTHHLVSEVTSLVAIERTPVRAAGAPMRADVPGLLPRGATPLAMLTATATAAPWLRLAGLATLLAALLLGLSFTALRRGRATPEPRAWPA